MRRCSNFYVLIHVPSCSGKYGNIYPGRRLERGIWNFRLHMQVISLYLTFTCAVSDFLIRKWFAGSGVDISVVHANTDVFNLQQVGEARVRAEVVSRLEKHA